MKPTVKEIAVFSVLGSMMYVTQVVMSFLPNIHLTGVFIVAITVVYRTKALYPLTVYIAISGCSRLCNMVDTVFIYMACALGGQYAFAQENAC